MSYSVPQDVYNLFGVENVQRIFGAGQAGAGAPLLALVKEAILKSDATINAALKRTGFTVPLPLPEDPTTDTELEAQDRATVRHHSAVLALKSGSGGVVDVLPQAKSEIADSAAWLDAIISDREGLLAFERNEANLEGLTAGRIGFVGSGQPSSPDRAGFRALNQVFAGGASGFGNPMRDEGDFGPP